MCVSTPFANVETWKLSLGTSKLCFQKCMGSKRTKGIQVSDVTLHTHLTLGLSPRGHSDLGWAVYTFSHVPPTYSSMVCILGE